MVHFRSFEMEIQRSQERFTKPLFLKLWRYIHMEWKYKRLGVPGRPQPRAGGGDRSCPAAEIGCSVASPWRGPGGQLYAGLASRPNCRQNDIYKRL